MKSNRTVLVAGQAFSVPPRIARCGNGWQVRYLGTRLFSDGKQGPRKSLAAAAAELVHRYALQPPKPATGRRSAPLAHKTNDLPAGISGPVLVRKPGRADSAEFKVSLPRRGKPNAGTSVYIASETTWSAERYAAALEKAKRLRAKACQALAA